MGGIGDFISAIINVITTLVDGYTKNAVGIAGFNKEGEIQNAVLDNLQTQYSGLEDSISNAALTQYQQQLEDETKKKVVTGNIISVTAALFMIIMIVLAVYIITKK